MIGYLKDQDIGWIVDQGVEKLFKPGEKLVTQDTPLISLFIITEGMFSIYKNANNISILAKIGSGEITGEKSFIDNKPPSVSVQAIKG